MESRARHRDLAGHGRSREPSCGRGGSCEAACRHSAGELRLEGLSAPVMVTRDALGIPTVSGASREDVARAPVSCTRRIASSRWISPDGAPRANWLRWSGHVRCSPIARFAFIASAPRRNARSTSMDPEWRAILDAYTAGVNSGLSRSASGRRSSTPCFGQEPRHGSRRHRARRPVDVHHAAGSRRLVRGRRSERCTTCCRRRWRTSSRPWARSGTRRSSDARQQVPPIPGPDVYDLRSRRTGKRPPKHEEPEDSTPTSAHRAGSHRMRDCIAVGRWQDVGSWKLGLEDEMRSIGSNNWAISGRLTDDGRAAPRQRHAPDRARAEHVVSRGARVAGRRQHIAPSPGRHHASRRSRARRRQQHARRVGLHQLAGRLERHRPARRRSADSNRYRTPDGWRTFERFDETIEVAGGAAAARDCRWTIWGPVMPPDHKGRFRAFRWVAHDADRLEQLDHGARIGAHDRGSLRRGQRTRHARSELRRRRPTRGESAGRSTARSPRRVGFDGRLPTSWADGTRGWSGWLNRAEYPRVVDPQSGRIWTANARVVDGDMLAKLGDGNYEVGSRARIIRERLEAQDRFTATDLLNIQLDTSAEFLTRWRTLLLEELKSVDRSAPHPPARDRRARLGRKSVARLRRISAHAHVPRRGHGGDHRVRA